MTPNDVKLKLVLKDKRLSASQRNDLEKWVDESLVRRIKDTTMVNRVYFMVRFADFVKKPFKRVTKEEVIEFFKNLSGIGDSGMSKYQFDIKLFFKWLYGMQDEEAFPEVVSWIKQKRVIAEDIVEDEILTPNEINGIIKSSTSIKDKALISMLYETGVRSQELLNLNIADVRFNHRDAVVKIKNTKGVSGYRENLLIDSVFCVQQWLRNHPLRKEDPKTTPLFVAFKKDKGEYVRLSYAGLYHIVERRANEAGIKKKCNPHWFRHSRVSEMAKLLPDAELRIFCGHKKNSMTIARYTHLNSDNVMERIRASRGLQPMEKVEIKEEKFKECGRCGELVNSKDSYCSKCGLAINVKTASDDKKERAKIIKIMLDERIDNAGLEGEEIAEAYDKIDKLFPELKALK